LLTILGIVIGITTVVTVSSLLTGLRDGIVVFFQELGPDSVFLSKTSGDPSNPFPPPKEVRRRPIRVEYADIIKRLCPSVDRPPSPSSCPPLLMASPSMAKVPGADSDQISVVGDQPISLRDDPRELAAGRFFTPEEDRQPPRASPCSVRPSQTPVFSGRRTAVGRTVQRRRRRVLPSWRFFAKAKGGFRPERRPTPRSPSPSAPPNLRYSRN